MKLNYSNSLTQGLTFLWAGPHTGGSHGIDLISRTPGAPQLAGADELIRTVTPSGIALRGADVWDAADTYYLDFDIPDQTLTSDGYCVAMLNRRLGSGAFQALMTGRDDGGGIEFYILVHNGNLVWVGPGESVDNFITAPDTNNWHMIAYQRVLGSSTQGLFYIDGVPVTPEDAATNAGTDVLAKLQLFGNQTYPSDTFDGEMLLAGMWTRLLTPQEHRRLATNPWQIFKPQRMFVPVFPYFPVDVQAQLVGETLTITLVDAAGTTLNSLTGLSWAWFDQSTVNTLGTPSVQGTGETTDGSGVLQISVSGTTLTSGQTGTLALMDSTGYIYALYRVTL